MDIIERLKEDWHFIKYNFVNSRMCLCGEHALEASMEISRLRAQRDAWKEVAEHQYGLLRAEKYGDEDYPVQGALDVWAAGRHPILTPNARNEGTPL